MKSLKDIAVFVTGAGGFIGSHLCERLVSEGARVKALIRYSSRADWGNLEFLPDDIKSQIEVVAGNIEDGDFVDKCMSGVECVFHLAALIGIPFSYAAPRCYVRTNVEGTLNILEAARRNGVRRVIHTSTSEVYGTARYTPIDEKHPLQGQSPYSASKIGADKMAESYHCSFGLPVVTVRPFNTFGPRQSARAVIPTVISQALSQPEISLGSLEPVRDLTFVKDTCGGFVRAALAEGVEGAVINLGTGSGISIGDLARKILDTMGVQKKIRTDADRVRPDKSEVLKLICDNSRAGEMLGWQPEYSLEAGLAETVEFVRSHPAFYRPERYTV